MEVVATSEVRLAELMLVVLDQFREHTHACIAQFDLSAPQAAALLRLDQALSQRELASCLKYDASNITAIVDSLAERGLVERQIDPSDRRVRRLVATTEGNRVLGLLRERLLDEAPLFQTLRDDERAQLHALLAKAVGDRKPTAWVEMFRGPRRSE